MNKALSLQLTASLMILEELQQHSDNPEKYEVYELQKNKLKEILAGVTTRSPSQTPSRPFGLPFGDPRQEARARWGL